eukprot:scaffold57_cov254-Pinguiococcus_pyrenoidosus.AAC.16
MQKHPNGYGISTSVLSASHIGQYDHSSAKRRKQMQELQKHLDRERLLQAHVLSTLHPFRKSLHRQKFYPATLQKLQASKMQRDPALEQKGTQISKPFPRVAAEGAPS